MELQIIFGGIVILFLLAGIWFFLTTKKKTHKPRVAQELTEVYNDKTKARLYLGFFRFNGKNYSFDVLLKNNGLEEINAGISIDGESHYLKNIQPNETKTTQILLEKKELTQVELAINNSVVFKEKVDFKKIINELEEQNQVSVIEEEKLKPKPTSEQIRTIELSERKPKTEDDKKLLEIEEEEKELETSYLHREIDREVYNELVKELQREKIKLKVKTRKKS
ncbi:MAG: hypothetical protein ABH803_04115 [Candidatus Micrarchaeota archaeon]